MSMNASLSGEVRELVIALNSCDATDEQIARLDDLICQRNDAPVRCAIGGIKQGYAHLVGLDVVRARIRISLRSAGRRPPNRV